MAEERKREELNLRLPSELKYDDFFKEDRKWSEDCGLGAAKACFAFGTDIPFMFASNIESPVASVTETETESEDEDYLAGLTQSMAQSLLNDDDDENETSVLPAKATMTVSPQSTLCSCLSASKDSFPPLKEKIEVQQHVVDQEMKNPMPAESVPSKKTVSSVSRPVLNNQHQKSQPQSVWTAQNKSRIGVGNYQALGVPSSAWPPLQKQQQQPQSRQPKPQPQQQKQKQPMLSPGMKTMFLAP